MATFYSYLVLLVILFKSSQSAGLHDDIIIGNIPRPRLERQVAQTYYHEPTAEDLEAAARLEAFWMASIIFRLSLKLRLLL